MLAVLPAALTAAAAAVDEASRDLPPLRVEPVGGLLGRAIESYAGRWARADAELTTGLDDAVRLLRRTAARYAELEDLLVPRSLR